MKRYFAVKNVELPDFQMIPGYFGKNGFASTNPSTEEVEKFGFRTEDQAVDEEFALFQIFGSGKIHGYHVQVFDL